MSNSRKVNKQFERDYNCYRAQVVHPQQENILTLCERLYGESKSSRLDELLPRWSPDAIKEEFDNRLTNDNGSYRMITISPKFIVAVDWEDCYEKVKRVLAKTANHYLLIPALDEKERMHYHGIVQFQKRSNQIEFKKYCNEYVGFSDIQMIKDTQKWYNYVFDEHQMTEVFNQYDDIKCWTHYVVRDYIADIAVIENDDE